jgi:uncharacterized membrane protein
MEPLSVEAALRFGWETFKKRPGFFIGITLIIGIVSWLVGFVVALVGLKGGIAGGVINLLISTLVDIGVTAILLKAYDNAETPQFSDLWHPQQYVSYLIATVLVGICVVVGIVLLIVPGVIAAIMFMFAKFVVVDRNMNPIDAMKESARITKGHRFTLLLLILALVAINIVGAILLLVGLLVTIPVSGLAAVYAYRKLSHTVSEVVPAPAAAPAL